MHCQFCSDSLTVLLPATTGGDGKKLAAYLHSCASESGSAELCIELLKVGANPNSPDANVNTALHLAAKSGNLAVAKALCEHGANVMARNNNNRTPKMLVSSAQLSLACDVRLLSAMFQLFARCSQST